MSLLGPDSFWRDVLAVKRSVSVIIVWRALALSLATALIYVADEFIHADLKPDLAPYEFAGAALSVLLVLRTTAGYERWWEARKLWGGITNQSRNVVIAGLAYGPADPAWRRALVQWTAVFAHVCRRSLREERDLPEVAAILGDAETARIAAAPHMPSHVSSVIASLLRDAVGRNALSWLGLLQLERERATLIDHIGGCERILKTPLPRAYAIEIRRFIFAFLVTLPIPLVLRAGILAPLVTFMISYPILALDEIGSALQNPFSTRRLNHLPLDDFCRTIEDNLNALLQDSIARSPLDQESSDPI